MLPGSRGVVFNVEPVDNTDDQRDIDIVDVTTGERRTLVRNGTYARYAARALLYGQAGSLYALPFDAARLAVTGPASPVLGDVRMDLEATGRMFVDVALSGALAYVPGFPRPGVRRLVWMDRQGVATPVTTETRAYRGGRLSPDGRSLAVTMQDGGITTLWLFDLGRRTWNRLTTEGEAVTPAWTPDSRRILFSANLRNGAGIHVVPADGSAPPSPIAAAGTQLIDMPEVQPGGRQALVALQDASGDDIYRLSLDGRATLEPVVTGLGSQVSPALSPSGRFLAYSSNESGRREIFVRSMTGQEQKWTVSVAGGSTPRWRQDERELFYVEEHATDGRVDRGRGHAVVRGAARPLRRAGAGGERDRPRPLRRDARWPAVSRRAARSVGNRAALDRRRPALRRRTHGASAALALAMAPTCGARHRM